MRPVPRRVYADTSVFGGCFDTEFEVHSNAFLQQVREGGFKLVFSPLVQVELAGVPDQVRDLADAMLPLAELVDPSDQVLRLADAYRDEGVLTAKWLADAMHVASAVVAQCDIIVSWNFKHIVHIDKIKRYNAVNVLHGYREIEIHTPSEVVRYEEDL